MKKVTLFLFLLLSTTIFAQNNSFGEQVVRRDIKKNEVSINALNILAFGVLDVSYERILNKYSSLSVGLFSNILNINKEGEENLSDVFDKNFSLTTKYKYFFGEDKTAWGFYTELLGMVSTGSDLVGYYEYDPVTEEEIYREREEDYYTDFALGVGVGYKYAARQGFIIDLSFGLGRNLFNEDSPNLILLPAIDFGYRF